ncbi:MAG: ROK family protein, partial [Candidatus Omnitrophota bacterium]
MDLVITEQRTGASKATKKAIPATDLARQWSSVPFIILGSPKQSELKGADNVSGAFRDNVSDVATSISERAVKVLDTSRKQLFAYGIPPAKVRAEGSKLIIEVGEEISIEWDARPRPKGDTLDSLAAQLTEKLGETFGITARHPGRRDYIELIYQLKWLTDTPEEIVTPINPRLNGDGGYDIAASDIEEALNGALDAKRSLVRQEQVRAMMVQELAKGPVDTTPWYLRAVDRIAPPLSDHHDALIAEVLKGIDVDDYLDRYLPEEIDHAYVRDLIAHTLFAHLSLHKDVDRLPTATEVGMYLKRLEMQALIITLLAIKSILESKIYAVLYSPYLDTVAEATVKYVDKTQETDRTELLIAISTPVIPDDSDVQEARDAMRHAEMSLNRGIVNVVNRLDLNEEFDNRWMIDIQPQKLTKTRQAACVTGIEITNSEHKRLTVQQADELKRQVSGVAIDPRYGYPNVEFVELDELLSEFDRAPEEDIVTVNDDAGTSTASEVFVEKSEVIDDELSITFKQGGPIKWNVVSGKLDDLVRMLSERLAEFGLEFERAPAQIDPDSPDKKITMYSEQCVLVSYNLASSKTHVAIYPRGRKPQEIAVLLNYAIEHDKAPLSFDVPAPTSTAVELTDENVEDINTIAKFLAMRNVPELTQEALMARYGFKQAGALVVMGSEHVEVLEEAAAAYKRGVVKNIVATAGGIGHATGLLADNIAKSYPHIKTRRHFIVSVFYAAWLFISWSTFNKGKRTWKQVFTFIKENLWLNARCINEGEMMKNVLNHLGVPVDIVEGASTNSCFNARRTLQLIKDKYGDDNVPKSVIIMQKPLLQRRADASFKYEWRGEEGVEFINYSVHNYDQGVPENILSDNRCLSLVVGEIPRLWDDENNTDSYGPKGKGWIAHVDVPRDVLDAQARLEVSPNLQGYVLGRRTTGVAQVSAPVAKTSTTTEDELGRPLVTRIQGYLESFDDEFARDKKAAAAVHLINAMDTLDLLRKMIDTAKQTGANAEGLPEQYETLNKGIDERLGRVEDIIHSLGLKEEAKLPGGYHLLFKESRKVDSVPKSELELWPDGQKTDKRSGILARGETLASADGKVVVTPLYVRNMLLMYAVEIDGVPVESKKGDGSSTSTAAVTEEPVARPFTDAEVARMEEALRTTMIRQYASVHSNVSGDELPIVEYYKKAVENDNLPISLKGFGVKDWDLVTIFIRAARARSFNISEPISIDEVLAYIRSTTVWLNMTTCCPTDNVKTYNKAMEKITKLAKSYDTVGEMYRDFAQDNNADEKDLVPDHVIEATLERYDPSMLSRELLDRITLQRISDMAATDDVAVAMKFGGTTTAVALVDSEGNIHLVDKARTPTKHDNWFINLFSRFRHFWIIKKQLRKAIRLIGRDHVSKIGIASPGPLIPDQEGKTMLAPNLENIPLYNFRLQHKVERAFRGLEVEVRHDGAASILGETSKRGTLPNAKDAVYFIWGTGLGNGVIRNGELFLNDPDGVGGMTGEYGHLVIHNKETGEFEYRPATDYPTRERGDLKDDEEYIEYYLGGRDDFMPARLRVLI